MLDRDYILEKHTILNDFTLNKDLRDSLREKRRFLQEKIDSTCTEIVDLYADQESKIAQGLITEYGSNMSYGAKAGGIINRRNKLKKELRLLDE
jgi:hypothetical protein